MAPTGHPSAAAMAASSLALVLVVSTLVRARSVALGARGLAECAVARRDRLRKCRIRLSAHRADLLQVGRATEEGAALLPEREVELRACLREALLFRHSSSYGLSGACLVVNVRFHGKMASKNKRFPHLGATNREAIFVAITRTLAADLVYSRKDVLLPRHASND